MAAIGASPTEKHVLLVLALRADTATMRCTPGIARLATDTGLNERSVTRAIAALEAAGHIDREERPGRGVVYTVHPRTDPDDAASPAADVDPRHKVTPDTESPLTQGLETPDTESPKLPRTTIPPKPPKGEKRRAARAMIDEGGGWTAPPIASLPATARTVAEQWPPGAYETEAAGHAKWLASGRRRRDPDASWHARVVQLGAKPIQAGRAGLRYRAAQPAAGGATVLPSIARCGTAGENAAAASLRTAIAASIGETEYGRWLEPCRFEIDEEQLTVIAPTEFVRSYCNSTFEQPLSVIAARVMGAPLPIGWKVEALP